MKKTLLASILLASLPFSSAHAEVRFNGFANIVAGQTSNDDLLWGYDEDISFKQDSLFALQTTADLGENLTATAQIIARGENNWEAEFEWAYLAYDINDQTRIIAGRQRAPLFMYSDYLDVSYAYPWITPPDGVYNLEVSKLDGVSINYNFTLSDFDVATQLFVGSNEDDIDVSGVVVESQFEQMLGATVTVNRDWLTLRSAFLSTDLSVPIDVFDQLGQAWLNIPGFSHVGEELVIDEDRAEFSEFGLQIDYENWLLIGEYTHIEYEGMPLDTEKSMFVTAGYRFDDVLVHLTYGKDDNEVDNVANTLPEGVSAELDQLISLTRQGLAFRDEDSSYYTLGARWDFHSSAAFKFEVSRHNNDLVDQDTTLLRTALVTTF